MKKMLALTLAVLLMAALFAGCGDSAVGYYKVKSLDGKSPRAFMVDRLGAAVTEGDIQQAMINYGISSLDELITIELKENHTSHVKGILRTEGFGEWKQSGSDITIGKVKGTYKDGEITATHEGITFVLVRTEQ